MTDVFTWDPVATSKSVEGVLPSAEGSFTWDPTTQTGKAPSLWERIKTAYNKAQDVTGPIAARSEAGAVQIGQEGKAVTNMFLGVPGGVAGVGMDALSRISSLMYGDTPKVAGQKARAVAEQVNQDWGKISSKLGLSQDATGSKIDELMNWGMEASDKGGKTLEAATKGVLSLETTQSVRDTLLNLLGVKGLGVKPKMKTAEIDEALVRKPQVEEAAKQTTAIEEAAKVSPEAEATAVQDLVTDALSRRTRLEQYWAGQKNRAKAPDPWEKTVATLVEDIPKVEEPIPQEGPGVTPKTKLEEGTVIGETPDLIQSGLDKLRAGELISKEEAKAIRRLTPRPGEGTIVDPSGKPFFQKGAVDPDLLVKTLGVMGLGVVAAKVLTDWYSSGGLSEDNSGDQFTNLAAGLMGATILHKGGKFEGMSESGLLETFRKGGREGEAAAAKIYEDTHRQLERSIAQMGKDLPVEDIAQRVYEKAFRNFALPTEHESAFRGEAKVSTFLYKIAQNEVKNAWEAEKVRPKTESMTEDTETGATSAPEKYMMEQSPEKYQSTEDVAAGNDVARRMQVALDKLPENYRKIFDGVELEGKPYEQVAQELGIPVGTVRSGLSRAKEQLQRSFTDYVDPKTGKFQAGGATPEQLRNLGLIAGGATLGAAMSEDKLKGALLGAVAGFTGALALRVAPKEAAAAIAKGFAPDTRIRVDQFADAHDAGMVTARRAIWQQQNKVMETVKTAEDLNQITHAIQQGKVGELPAPLQTAANVAKSFFAAMGDQAKKAGLIKDLIDDYVTNLWDLTGKNKDVWDSILNRAGGPSMSPETRFALKRSIMNLKVGKKLGLVPLTENIAQIMGIYGESLSRSIENAKMLNSLKSERDTATGLKLVLSSESAPHAYVNIDSPQFSGLRVHPDIAPSLAFIFDKSNAGALAQGFQALNVATKRSAVVGSFFHAKALLDGFVAAASLNKKLIAGGAVGGALYGVATNNNPVVDALLGAGVGMMGKGLKLIGQAALPRAFGTDIYLKQLAEGHAGDLVGTLLNSGLKVSFERGALAVEDVEGSFYAGMKGLQDGLDKMIPYGGAPVKAFTALNHAVDTFMWERLHASMKLTIAAQKLEQLIQNNAKAHLKDPQVALKTMEKLAVDASSFTNDIFGGLDWRRIAESTTTKFGRDLALQVYSPTGRRIAQLALFAPDWTVSTTRAATQAFSPSIADLNPKKLLQTFLAPENAVGLHRQYMVRSALYYATIANGINYMMSGHYVWDNKDWTTIDLGDGRTMQWSKHMMEPVHWAMKPMQQAANKLGYFPKEAINQLTGKEYISAAGKSPPMDTSALGRIEHLGKSALPISAQGAFGAQGSVGDGVSSMLGVPIYGKTYEQKAAAKAALRQLHSSSEYKELQKARKEAAK